MYCFLRETAVPFYLAKEEVVNIEPRISLFHDVISDYDITYLKREATKKVLKFDKYIYSNQTAFFV
jgi:hypothetical protein